MSVVPAPPRVVRIWMLVLGLVLLVPQLVLAVVVIPVPVVVGLSGFAMTIGFIRLASTGYQTLRARTPPVHRGVLALAGAIGTLAGSTLWSAVAVAARALGDDSYAGAIAPPAAIGLNLLVILTLGLWITGVVVVISAAIGAFRDRRR